MVADRLCEPILSLSDAGPVKSLQLLTLKDEEIDHFGDVLRGALRGVGAHIQGAMGLSRPAQGRAASGPRAARGRAQENYDLPPPTGAASPSRDAAGIRRLLVRSSLSGGLGDCHRRLGARTAICSSPVG